MNVRPEQLQQHLQRGLAPLYLIHGDEPLLALEAADTIRHHAREQGYADREVLSVESGFDWSQLALTANSGSLFADRKLLELRLGSSKPGDAGGKALRAYAQDPSPDAVLLISADKLDQSMQKSRWFSALDGAGVVIQIWPLDSRQLPRWLAQRMQNKGLQATPDAVKLLAARVEGNLLAAAQEIDKLYLLYGKQPLSAGQLQAAVEDSAYYTIYDLVDAALAARNKRVVRILSSLRAEGAEPVLLLWALARDIRLLVQLQTDIARGLSVPAALTRHKVWKKRQPLMSKALQQLSQQQCQQLLSQCAQVDKVIKGAATGNLWDELLALSLQLAGTNLRIYKPLNR